MTVCICDQGEELKVFATEETRAGQDRGQRSRGCLLMQESGTYTQMARTCSPDGSPNLA
jgi:hypothetical protein